MKNAYIVTDTSVFIDLYSVSLLDAFFHLPWEFHAPDYVIKELTNNAQLTALQEFIQIGKLKSHGHWSLSRKQPVPSIHPTI